MNKYDKASSPLFSNPWVFIGVTFAWTWAFWGSKTFTRQHTQEVWA